MYQTTIRFHQVLSLVAAAEGDTQARTAPAPPAPPPPASAGDPADSPGTQADSAERSAIEAVLASLGDAARALRESQCQLLGELQQAAIELAVAVAGRLIGEKIQANQFPIEKLVRQATDRLGGKGPVQVSLHPDDWELLVQRIGQAPSPLGDDVQLVSDPAIQRGDCTVEAGGVQVLSQLEVQLGDIRQHLLRSISNAEVERRAAVPGDRALRRFPDRRQTA